MRTRQRTKTTSSLHWAKISPHPVNRSNKKVSLKSVLAFSSHLCRGYSAFRGRVAQDDGVQRFDVVSRAWTNSLRLGSSYSLPTSTNFGAESA